MQLTRLKLKESHFILYLCRTRAVSVLLHLVSSHLVSSGLAKKRVHTQKGYRVNWIRRRKKSCPSCKFFLRNDLAHRAIFCKRVFNLLFNHSSSYQEPMGPLTRSRAKMNLPQKDVRGWRGKMSSSVLTKALNNLSIEMKTCTTIQQLKNKLKGKNCKILLTLFFKLNFYKKYPKTK